MSDIKKLLNQVKEAREKWNLSDDDLKFLSNLWTLSTTSRIQDVHNDEFNAIWWNYSDNAYKTAALKKEVDFDAANKLTNIEEASSKVKEKRSDDTRAELLDNTWVYRDKQEQRYKDIQDIVDTQKRIANRQANIEAAQSWRYWDVYTDSTESNIKNDIINRYWDNISAAMQYALQNNRAVDQDVLNVWLTEVNDKDKRDAFKDALLDKNNSYIMDAIRSAAAWDKKALEDVENFYQAAVRDRWEKAIERSWQTQKREFYEKEFKSLSREWKAQMLRDFTYNVPWYSLVADYIPEFIKNYPDLSLSELVGKMNKAWEYALSNKQLVASLQWDPNNWTEDQRKSYNYILNEWYHRLQEWNRTYPHTVNDSRNNTDRDWVNNTYNQNNYDNTTDKNNAINRANAESERNKTNIKTSLYDSWTWSLNNEWNQFNTNSLNNTLWTTTYNSWDSSNIARPLTLKEALTNESTKKKIEEFKNRYMKSNYEIKSEADLERVSKNFNLDKEWTKKLIDYINAQKWIT